MNDSHRPFLNLLIGVLQGCVLNPLLSNIYICDLFLVIEEETVTIYTDDTIHFSNGFFVLTILNDIEHIASNVFDWLCLKTNLEKLDLLLTSKEETSIQVEDCIIKRSTFKKLLGGIIAIKTQFYQACFKIIYKKASQKIHALGRISSYISTNKLRLIIITFFSSQFGNCPLIWIFHNRSLNNRINKLQERVLRLVHKDATSSFDELLEKENTFTIHHRSIQKLAIEMH